MFRPVVCEGVSRILLYTSKVLYCTVLYCSSALWKPGARGSLKKSFSGGRRCVPFPELLSAQHL